MWIYHRYEYIQGGIEMFKVFIGSTLIIAMFCWCGCYLVTNQVITNMTSSLLMNTCAIFDSSYLKSCLCCVFFVCFNNFENS